MDEKTKRKLEFSFSVSFSFSFSVSFSFNQKKCFLSCVQVFISVHRRRALDGGNLGAFWTPEPPCDQTRGTLGSFGHWTPGPDPGPPWTGALGHLDPLVQDPLDLDPWNPDWGHLGHLGAFPILGHYLLFYFTGRRARRRTAPVWLFCCFIQNKITNKSQSHSAMVDSRPEPSVRARFGGGAMAAAALPPSMT